MNLSSYTRIVQTWYQWGHFTAMALAAAAVIWVFLGAQRRGTTAIAWKALAICGFVLVFPSTILYCFPDIAAGTLAPAVVPLAYVGLGAAALTVLSLCLLLAGAGVKPAPIYCPQCGNELLPSWEYCPYCAQMQAQQQAAAQSPPPATLVPPPVTPTELATLSVPEPVEVQLPKIEATERLFRPEIQDLAWLVFLSGAHEGKEFRLGEVTTVGRNPEQNDIVIDDSTVSRQHAKIRLEEGHFTIYDLASSGGTFVKGESSADWTKIHEHRLEDEEWIKMGRQMMGFIQIASVQRDK